MVTTKLNQAETEEQFLDWCRNDPRFFLETCCEILAEDEQGHLVPQPFIFNNIQVDFHNQVYWYPEPNFAVRRVYDTITLKSRQYGHSTYILGDMFHGWCWNQSKAKVICYRDDTAKKLKYIIDHFYRSARTYFASMGLDPDEHLPFARLDNMHELYSETTGALIEFATEGAKGEGRSATVNRIYGTEYSEWTKVSSVMAGYSGSLTKISPVVDLDGTGKGIGNAMYQEYQAAKAGKPTEDAGSVYKPFFYGRNDYAYPEGFLRKQKARLKGLFVAEYPANDEEAFLTDDNSIFDYKKIEVAGGWDGRDFLERFLCDMRVDMSEMFFIHGCDPESGVPTGSKSGIATRELTSLMMACEPYNDFLSPRESAFELRRRLEKYPGLAVIEENNHGHAVIQKCEDLEIRTGRFAGRPMADFLYRHLKPGKETWECKLGWPETPDNKVLLEEGFEACLQNRFDEKTSFNLPSEVLRTQAREYCRNENGKTGRPLTANSSGGRFYDDVMLADMLSLKGIPQCAALMERETGPVPQATSGGSMRTDL